MWQPAMAFFFIIRKLVWWRRVDWPNVDRKDGEWTGYPSAFETEFFRFEVVICIVLSLPHPLQHHSHRRNLVIHHCSTSLYPSSKTDPGKLTHLPCGPKQERRKYYPKRKKRHIRKPQSPKNRPIPCTLSYAHYLRTRRNPLTPLKASIFPPIVNAFVHHMPASHLQTSIQANIHANQNSSIHTAIPNMHQGKSPPHPKANANTQAPSSQQA